jgi:uncharacterized protein (DUF4213/DUF364 family)
MASVGNVYLNFGLWAISLAPAWVVIKEIGVTLNGFTLKNLEEPQRVTSTSETESS